MIIPGLPEALEYLNKGDSMHATHDRLILKPIMENTETAGGIIIPSGLPSNLATVVSVGKGRLLDNGTYQKPDVKEGDTVLVGQYSELQNEDGLFWVCTEKEILGIVED